MKILGLALAFIACTVPSLAQSTQVWLDVYEPPTPLMSAFTSDALAFPGGGVVTASIGSLGGFASPGEAVIRRLSENGDVLWEVIRPLTTQDYIGLHSREYIAGIDVADSGEVAVAFGGAGPMEIRLYEPNGTLRWQQMIPVDFGPHFEHSTIGVSSGGDVVFASSEDLYQGGNIERFGLYRLAGANGQLLWSRVDSSNRFVEMALDPQGEAILAVNRESNGVRIWTVERYNPAGTMVGSATIETIANYGTILDIVVDDMGRTVFTLADAFVGVVIALTPAMTVEWETHIPPIAYSTISLMSDRDVVLTEVGGNWDLVRLDGVTGVAHYSAANVVGPHYFGPAVGLPNGNCVVAIGKWELTDGLCLQERDPSGAVVRTHMPATPYRFGSYDLALGERGNVYAAYELFDPQGIDRGGLEKIVFQDEQGTPYCGPSVPNSTGQSATIRSVGVTSVATNNLSLLFSGLPLGAPVLPIASQSMGFVMQPGGSQGNLCLSGSIGRFDEPGEIRFADADGLASMQVELLRMPTPGGLVPAVAGESWNFQAWFRDSVPMQASTSNFTDAVSVVLR